MNRGRCPFLVKQINKGYMVSPLALTERQLLIYRALYSRCNFENMLVDMTIEQIKTSIKIVDLTDKVIYLDLKKMIEAGCIEQVKKKSKGNAPVYKLIKYEQISGKLKVSQGEVKGKLKPSISNRLSDDMGSNTEVEGKLKVSTIKEKEKEINIYSRVITRLNDSTSKKYKANTKKTIACIDARLNEGFSEEDFYKVIDIKTNEWLGNETMEKFLRPETLFGNKFEGYLNQTPKEHEQSKEMSFGYPAIDYSKMTPEQIMELGTKGVK